MEYSVVIVAAGNGSRMNLGYNKVFYELEPTETVLSKSIKLFDQHTECAQIIVVTQKENWPLCQFECKTPLVLCEGGQSRSESVMKGLSYVSEDIVMVHDGARPYVSEKSLNDLLGCLENKEACLLAVPCKDTIKVVQEGIVVDTPIRSTLYQAQTPQAFKTSLLKQAYEKAQQSSTLTDDASCVEQFTDTKVAIVLGDYRNIKITTPEDIQRGK